MELDENEWNFYLSNVQHFTAWLHEQLSTDSERIRLLEIYKYLVDEGYVKTRWIKEKRLWNGQSRWYDEIEYYLTFRGLWKLYVLEHAPLS